MTNFDKKEQKRVHFHEKNIEVSKQKIWKYEQKIATLDLTDKKKEMLQQKINHALHFIEMQENIIENPGFIAQSE